jgi:DNA-directed RNA polymerase subunit H
MAKKTFNVENHILVPKHIKLKKKELNELLEKYSITPNELPSISIKDPALEKMDVSLNDIIKIIRSSPTAKKSFYYRRVVK